MIYLIEATTTGFGTELIHKGIEAKTVRFYTADVDKYQLHPKLRNGGSVCSLDHIRTDVALDSTSPIVWSNSDAGLDVILADPSLLSCLPNKRLIQLCRNKNLFKEHLPDFSPLQFRNLRSLQSAAPKAVIQKPFNGSGSVGIKYIAIENYCSDTSTPTLLNFSEIVEEYIDGPEYSAEILLSSSDHRILACFRKVMTNLPNCLELAHLPINVDKFELFLRPLCERLSDLVDSDYYLVHVEFKIKSNRLYIIEVNARPCGSLLPWCIESNMYVLVSIVLDGLTFANPRGSGKILPILNVPMNRVVCSTVSPSADSKFQIAAKKYRFNIIKSYYNPSFRVGASDFTGRFSTYCVDIGSSSIEMDAFEDFYMEELYNDV